MLQIFLSFEYSVKAFVFFNVLDLFFHLCWLIIDTLVLMGLKHVNIFYWYQVNFFQFNLIKHLLFLFLNHLWLKFSEDDHRFLVNLSYAFFNITYQDLVIINIFPRFYFDYVLFLFNMFFDVPHVKVLLS